MSAQQFTRRPGEDNPFAQLIDRLTGLACYWEIARDDNGDAMAALRRSLEETRIIVTRAVESEFEIAARMQRRLADRVVQVSAMRSPQDAWANQLETLALIADAGSEYAAAWADCCRSLRETCAPALRGSERRSKEPRRIARRQSNAEHVSP